MIQRLETINPLPPKFTTVEKGYRIPKLDDFKQGFNFEFFYNGQWIERTYLYEVSPKENNGFCIDDAYYVYSLGIYHRMIRTKRII